MQRDSMLAAAVMCLTQDGLGLSHPEQVKQLCAGGARWIQLRMKGADRGHWLHEARQCAAVCKAHGTLLVINDSVDIALESGADGVHLGGKDGDWREARHRLGPDRIVGGSINFTEDARRAVASGCLDYVGVGPLRFTPTKRDLSPVLGTKGVTELIAALGGIPAWVIGGITPADLPELKRAGAAGVAISSYLYRTGAIEENLRELVEAWTAAPSLPPS